MLIDYYIDTSLAILPCNSALAFGNQAHLATCIEERNRVVREGGRIEWLVDTWRVAPAGLQVRPLCIFKEREVGPSLAGNIVYPFLVTGYTVDRR